MEQNFIEWLNNKMESEGRKMSWLSEKIKMNYATLKYKIKTNTLTYEEEDKIKQALEK